MKIKDIKSNPNNPRVIRDDKFKKLVKSIKEFPKMMALRPMVLDENNIVLGGNMRLKALKELGYKEVPADWIKKANDLSEDEQRRFIIADNVGFGEHDYQMLKEEWNVEDLEDWGIEFEVENEHEELHKQIEEIEYSTELDSASNYIVLKFDKDIDFLQIKTLLDIKSTYSKRANGKPWSKGVGRVVDGVDAIEKLKNA